MTRDTSIQAYNDYRDSGKLSELQLRVLRVIIDHGPITQGECWSEFFATEQRHNVAPRFAELQRKGLIEAGGKRACRYSCKSVYTWKATLGKIAEEAKPKRIPCPHCSGKGYVAEKAMTPEPTFEDMYS